RRSTSAMRKTRRSSTAVARAHRSCASPRLRVTASEQDSLPSQSMSKVLNALASVLDPRSYLHALRLLHYYSYSHVREKRRMTIGRGTGFAPNVSIHNGERITIGRDCHIGERSYLWAGDSTGRIVIGDCVSLAP